MRRIVSGLPPVRILRRPQTRRDVVDGSGLDGHAVRDAGDPDDIVIRCQQIAVDLNVDETLGRWAPASNAAMRTRNASTSMLVRDADF